MGVAIHHGRVYLARFVAGRGELHSTVIGRNVNLAGRLSSAAKRPIEEDDGAFGALVEALPVAGRGVSVDEDGTLFNEGIALSRDALAQLEAHLAVERTAGGVVEYHHEAIDRRILIRYAGDAKFKDVRASLPAYEADGAGRGARGAALHAVEDGLRDDSGQDTGLRALPRRLGRGGRRPPRGAPDGAGLRRDEPLPLQRRARDGGPAAARGLARRGEPRGARQR